jgi:hypothetical protein
MSKNYEKVKRWAQDALDRWITADEYQEITGKEYEKE